MYIYTLLQKKITVPLWFPFLLLLTAYAGWEIYWFKQVGLIFIKWHTHLMLYVYLWILGIILFKLFSKHIAVNMFLSFSSILFVLLLLELGMMYIGYNKTYLENRSGQYQSVFNYKSTDSIRAYGLFQLHNLKTPEYDYARQCNSLGFSDEEWISDSSKILIQTYGDSFTEGDGAPFDSSYPAILRNLLGAKFAVQNYGICGNDPGFYVTQFGKVGSKFQPSAIVLCYGTGDFMNDFFSRGGLERFTESGWQTRKGPWWEVIYGISYTSRLFFHAFGIHYNQFFMTKADINQQLKLLQPKWNEMFDEIALLAAKQNTKVLLFKKPERSEIVLHEYQYNMAFFDSYLNANPIFKHVDLMPFYRDSAGLVSIKTTDPYYWQKDGHHNSKGYTVMARGVHSALKNKFPVLNE